MLPWTKPTINTLLTGTQSIDRLDAELLLAHVMSSSREFFITHASEKVSWLETRAFKQAVAQRQRGIPVAYITGHKEFYGLNFSVTRDTLIPRPETEHMVERIIQLIHTHQEGQILLLDIGTGSGCIPISVLKEIHDPTQVIKSIGTDISPRALAVAKQNATHHTREITWKQGYLLEPVVKDIKQHCCDIIISANLPYVSENDYLAESSIHAEPKSALVADEEGIALYRELITRLPKEAETRTTLFLEIDPKQTNKIKQILLERYPQAHISIIKDLAQRDRIVEIHL